MAAVVAAESVGDLDHGCYGEIIISPQEASDLGFFLIQAIGQFGAGDAHFLHAEHDFLCDFILRAFYFVIEALFGLSK